MKKGVFKYVTKRTLSFGMFGALGAGISELITEALSEQIGGVSFIGVVGYVALWSGIICKRAETRNGSRITMGTIEVMVNIKTIKSY